MKSERLGALITEPPAVLVAKNRSKHSPIELSRGIQSHKSATSPQSKGQTPDDVLCRPGNLLVDPIDDVNKIIVCDVRLPEDRQQTGLKASLRLLATLQMSAIRQ